MKCPVKMPKAIATAPKPESTTIRNIKMVINFVTEERRTVDGARGWGEDELTVIKRKRAAKFTN